MDIVQKAKEQLDTNRSSLHMNNVPTKTKHFFTEYALNEHSDNYGAALDAIIREWVLLKQVFEMANEFESRITALEQKSEKKEKVIKNIQGKVLRRIGNEPSSNG